MMPSVATPTPEERAKRERLCEAVALSVIECGEATEAVSALLSVIVAYLRTAPAELRMAIAQDAARLLERAVAESLG